ncbi:MAG: 50S ribosomal protein L11 [Candidatus Micrarchaeota archaeon]
MAKMTVNALIEGGKATAAPPLGPALAPTGIDIQKVVAGINEKTAAFKGMQVPVKVLIDKKAKTFEVEVGTPPASALIKKEAGVTANVKEEAGAKGKKVIGNISIDQAVKIAGMKESASLAAGKKNAVKEVAGTCLSLGITIEGKNAREFIKEVNAGNYDSKLAG